MADAANVQDPILIAAKRTPVGSLGGSLCSRTAVQLGAVAARAALEAAGIPPTEVDECIFGCVLTANLGQAPARQIAVSAGLPPSCRCVTINKVCASGAKAIALAAQSIRLGYAEVVVAGGTESMSNAPYLMGDSDNSGVNRARHGGLRLGHATMADSVMRDGLTDSASAARAGCAMGVLGDACAARYHLSREQQDAYALESYARARAAWERGVMRREVVSVPLAAGNADVDADEELNKLQAEKVPRLRPAFDKEHGTVTAANSSKISDGAAAVVLVSRRRAQQWGIGRRDGASAVSPPRLAYQVVECVDAEVEPEWFTVAPIAAIQRLLRMPAVQACVAAPEQVDCWEVNEAFSVVPLVAMQQLPAVRHQRLNMNGGAVALGHPLGCSGARIVVALTTVMEEHGFQTGVAAVCNGGGGATALLLRRAALDRPAGL
eukprot:ctg_1481.g430